MAWNNITGTSVFFVEVTAGEDIPVSMVVLPSATAAQTWISPGADFENVAIQANSLSENNGSLSFALKVEAMIHELGHTLNFLHTDRINNMGAPWYNVPGTANGNDPGSVFNHILGTTAKSFSSYDIIAIRTLYPSGLLLRRTVTGDLITEGPTVLRDIFKSCV